jgi:hypothetical protein
MNTLLQTYSDRIIALAQHLQILDDTIIEKLENIDEESMTQEEQEFVSELQEKLDDIKPTGYDDDVYEAE